MTGEASEPYGRQRQLEIFAMGKAGVPPTHPISNEDLRAAAREALDDDAWAYLAGGAGDETTMDSNRRALERWQILPRMLTDTSERSLGVTVLDTELPAPVVLAPIGQQSLFHHEAELASARGAAAAGLGFAASTVASETLEDVADALGDAPGWFQLYWNTDPDVTASFLSRAEDAGYEAVVVTVDTPVTGWRERELQAANLPFYDGHGMANYASDDAFAASLGSDPAENHDLAVSRLLETFDDPGRTWADFEALADSTDLPVLVKGILHPDDARLALDHAADGVIVSNHGGRQIDGSVGALRMLPEIADEVGDDGAVLFDSGIRGGADVFRAIALGADATLLGRPYIYGLAAGGAEGVEAVCQNLLAEFDLTMALAGYANVDDVDRDALLSRPD